MALTIIRGKNHTSYRDALVYFDMKTLDERRKELCLKFEKKAPTSEKFCNWFSKDDNIVNTRSTKTSLREVYTRTSRFARSPLPYLTKLLNKHLGEKDSTST